MKRIANRLAEWISQPWSRLQRRFERARPGSVLIMVVGLLVLLALMGTAYVSSARIERYAVTAGVGQRTLRESVDSYARQLLDSVKSMVGQDAGNVITAPTDPQAAMNFLAIGQPVLLPDLTVSDLKDSAITTPVWPRVSRFTGEKFESPYGLGNTLASFQYQDDPSSYLAPTNIVINYTSTSGVATDPALYGQTRTYPAFSQYVIDPTDVTQRKWYSPPGQPANSPSAGPFIAGDATGMGIADTAMKRLSSGSIMGVDFYGGIRVIDNGSKINLNTAWTSQRDLDKLNNCYNFFPCDIDLLGMMNVISSASYAISKEMNAINTRRFIALGQPRRDDAGVNHTDFAYLNNANEFWMQLGGRPGNPNALVNFGDPVGGKFGRPFGDSDTAGLVYHGGLINWGNPLSKLDTLMSNPPAPNAAVKGNDSIFAGAANALVNSQNQFSYFAANNVGYWYDWYTNFDDTPSTLVGDGIKFPFASQPLIKSVSGQQYRPIRQLLAGSNPVANMVTQIPFSVMPAEAKTNSLPVSRVVNPGIHPHKAGLNTSGFPDLWRAFINVMGGSYTNAAGLVQFTVPGDPLTIPAYPALTPPQLDDATLLNQNQGTFRNVLRDVNSGSTVNSSGLTSTTAEKYRDINLKSYKGGRLTTAFDSKNVLLLRAALAAVNVRTLRETHGTTAGTNFFIPRIAEQTISLTTVGANAGSVDVMCYGVSAQPFITEVYACTDGTPHTDAKGVKTQNTNGLVVIKLFNPYPYPLLLTGYRFAIVDRRITPPLTYPAMKTSTYPLTSVISIPANGTTMLTNYTGAGNDNYWPSYMNVAAPTAGPKCVQVKELTNVLEGSTVSGPQSKGSEFVLLAPVLSGSGTGIVPVDSYDFTGLKLNGAAKTMINWHYVRAQGKLPANRWKCVYPGEYNASNAAKIGTGGTYTTPRMEGTEVSLEYDPAAKKDDPWDPLTTGYIPPTTKIDVGSSADNSASYPNPYNGIELCNVDSAGFHDVTALKRFPYGGFARAGDVLQVPFIGHYIVLPPGTAASPGTFPTTVMEVNPVTMDSSLVDDNDSNDDAAEHLGRFIPIAQIGPSVGITPKYDDYSPYGYYTSKDPDTGQILAQNAALKASPTGEKLAYWRYRWAMGVTDQFTTVSNPESDYYPNMIPAAWLGTGVNAPKPVLNTKGATVNVNEYATEGLVNINSASWRVLAAMEMIPKLKDPTGAFNARLAKLIVRYRDVDDGIPRTYPSPYPAAPALAGMPRPLQGHGAFKSVMELNKVFDPFTPANTFQNGLGLLPLTAAATDPADVTYFGWGNYSPGPFLGATNVVPVLKGKPLDNRTDADHDWMPSTLMVRRISNLISLRSDSFTAYVIVQGWRNTQTPYPELVIQKRLAVLLDRSSLGNATTGLPTPYTVPTD